MPELTPESDSTDGKNKKKCHIQGNIENKAENPLELLDACTIIRKRILKIAYKKLKNT
jgi:hypothetical protein